jgi:hypothetical protein
MSDTLIVATEATVKGRLKSLGCTWEASAAATADRYRMPTGHVFFFPKQFGLGYTQSQLDHIEQSLAACGLDMFPLDPNFPG